ncbi:hypothetical protein ABK040_011906 [Willaertia magna]
MKILKTEEFSLTNYEVQQVIQQQFETRKDNLHIKEFNIKRNRDPILDFHCRLLYYFDKQSKVKYQNNSTIENLLKELSRFELTKQEKMSIINSMPDTLVEIHLIIDNCVNRFSEDQTLEMIEIIRKNLLSEAESQQQQFTLNKEDKNDKSSSEMNWFDFVSKIEDNRRKKAQKTSTTKQQTSSSIQKQQQGASSNIDPLLELINNHK